MRPWTIILSSARPRAASPMCPWGSTSVRPGRDLHRRAMLYAKRRGINLNTVVSDALRRYLERDEHAA